MSDQSTIANQRPKVNPPGVQSRLDFPIFERFPKLAFLDSAASAQKPRVVIDRLTQFLSHEYANIHRGVYELSSGATEAYSRARRRIASFVGAKSAESIVFTKGTTEGINLVAHSLEGEFAPGDTILLTLLEHHSNIVPWQLLAERRKLRLVYAAIDQHGNLDLQDFERKLKSEKPKLVAVTAISNALGSVLPIKQIVAQAHAAKALVLVDAAQAISHQSINLAELNPDFLVFSGHKAYGPTGIGVLYVAPTIVERLKPYQGGGGMIDVVTTEKSTWAQAPMKFEAGTPPIAEAIALGTALDYLENIGLSTIAAHEDRLLAYAVQQLSKEKGVRLFAPCLAGGPQAGIISFTVDGVHPHDLATVADGLGVQIRAGHHCAMPLMTHLGIPATARASFGIYSIAEDVDLLVQSIRDAKKLFCI